MGSFVTIGLPTARLTTFSTRISCFYFYFSLTNKLVCRRGSKRNDLLMYDHRDIFSLKDIADCRRIQGPLHNRYLGNTRDPYDDDIYLSEFDPELFFSHKSVTTDSCCCHTNGQTISSMTARYADVMVAQSEVTPLSSCLFGLVFLWDRFRTLHDFTCDVHLGSAATITQKHLYLPSLLYGPLGGLVCLDGTPLRM